MRLLVHETGFLQVHKYCAASLDSLSCTSSPKHREAQALIRAESWGRQTSHSSDSQPCVCGRKASPGKLAPSVGLRLRSTASKNLAGVRPDLLFPTPVKKKAVLGIHSSNIWDLWSTAESKFLMCRPLGEGKHPGIQARAEGMWQAS